MKPAKLALLTLLLGCTLTFAKPASNTGAPASQPGQEGTNQSPAQNPAMGDDAQQYEEAYNKGDAKALAGFYSEDVDYTDPDGAEVKGRDAMEKLLADNFAQNPGVKLSIRTDEIKQVTPDVKVSRGVATVTLPNGAAQATRYTAVRVKKGDHWEITQLTETDAPAPSASSQLETLDWLVGSWEDKSGDQVVQTKTVWAGDKNFLVRTFKVKGADQSETDGWEIVGWDPIRQQIRSWIFDSNGGFGEASWVYDGDDWLIRASNVLPDGSRSTAENLLTKVDDNNFTWQSQNRTLNGEPQPALDTIEVRRASGSQ
ncbi:MAG: SgcJ/EcaC family oxidoreductase [Verrucomicrobia bacterium]|nr:SgcJ/EcaC family oxidoreductase [Verrucomicrobiota bacterium]